MARDKNKERLEEERREQELREEQQAFTDSARNLDDQNQLTDTQNQQK
ncbi:hypothetical protein H1Q58_01620 [Planococcus maritimus]|uniref:Uncharacterized protein n=1 Tax=Planococcus maritimus TaxID=192421 RepID=A0A7D7MBT4_PLAMR|nr:hypothetical protein [Planococcus maritimus]QMT17755.1 hypothetical protein H1Q58_01620 [Planococcus maritimus]